MNTALLQHAVDAGRLLAEGESPLPDRLIEPLSELVAANFGGEQISRDLSSRIETVCNDYQQLVNAGSDSDAFRLIAREVYAIALEADHLCRVVLAAD